MRLDIKELIAKLTKAEPSEELLSTTARLIRIGRYRTLVLNGYQLSEGVTLAQNDRPSHAVEAIMWANYNGTYWKSGNVLLNTSGQISAYTATSYNANSSQGSLGTAEKIICTLNWLVGGYCLAVFSRLTGVLRHRKVVA